MGRTSLGTGRFSAQEVSHAIITVGMWVHSELGPGLLESTYEACLRYGLQNAGLFCEAQLGLPVVYHGVKYHGVKLDLGYRIDLLVQDLVIVEIRSVEAISPVHQAQVIWYLKLSGKSPGLLINFNVAHRKDGIRRFCERRRLDAGWGVNLLVAKAAHRVYVGGAQGGSQRSQRRNAQQ